MTAWRSLRVADEDWKRRLQPASGLVQPQQPGTGESVLGNSVQFELKNLTQLSARRIRDRVGKVISLVAIAWAFGPRGAIPMIPARARSHGLPGPRFRQIIQ